MRIAIPPVVAVALALLACSVSGCTCMREYLANGFKVGPNYCPPRAPVAEHWIDAADKRVRSDEDDLAGWWTIFGDPLLNRLMVAGYEQNLTLREAGYRIMAARARLGITRGEFFPQSQFANGSLQRIAAGTTNFNQWNMGFASAWELDFWGRFRRAIIAAEATLDASVFDYDDVLVTLLSDVASSYTVIRTSQERIRLLTNLINLQEDVLHFIDERLAAGFAGVTELDRAQARSNLRQSLAQRDALEALLRTSQNQLCILLGRPATDITAMLASVPNATIPVAPEYVVVGIPADLLRRRPDVRRAERLVAAQAEQIGIAEAALYPAISISGNLGWQAAELSDLFTSQSFVGSMGPSFRWNLLNYGRIVNNVRLQDAQLRELIVAYQNLVLQADLEVENGIVTFLQAQEQARNMAISVDEAYVALEVIAAQYQAGLAGVDFNRYAVIQQALVAQQDSWAQARGQIAQGLISVYRGLGGGWQIRMMPVPDKRGILSPLPAVNDEKAEEVPPPGEEIPRPIEAGRRVPLQSVSCR